MVLSVADLGDREQRGDRPALDDLEVVVDQAPFDVLGAAEVRFDPPAQLREPHDLRVRQRRLLLPRRLDRLFLRPACRRGVDGELLGGDRLGDDLAVAHLVDVRVHQAGDQGLAEAEAGLHGGDLPVGRDGVGREQDAGRLREDHLLHDHGHVDLPVVEAVPQAVGHGPLGEERGPAPADVLEDRRRPHDVQVRVLLAREGGRRQVLRRRAGSDGVGGLLAEPGERAGDRRRQIVGDGDPFEGPADLRAERADRLPVVRLQARQPIEPIVDRRRFRHDPPEGVRRHAEASRHADAFDPRELPQVRALAADDRDLRLVDLLETQHVAAHPLTRCIDPPAIWLRSGDVPSRRTRPRTRAVRPFRATPDAAPAERFGIGHRQVTQATGRARELRLAHPLSVGMPSHTPIMQRIPLLDQTLTADFLSLSADRARCPSSVATGHRYDGGPVPGRNCAQPRRDRSTR